MNKRGAGVSFCFIAAFLFAMRYLIITLGGYDDLSSELSVYMPVASLAALVVGILYIRSSLKES